jgi:hypothetical protein
MTHELKKRGKLDNRLWNFFLTGEMYPSLNNFQTDQVSKSQIAKSILTKSKAKDKDKDADPTESAVGKKADTDRQNLDLDLDSTTNIIKVSKGNCAENLQALEILKKAVPAVSDFNGLLEAYKRKRNQDVIKTSQEKVRKLGFSPLERLLVNQTFCFES